MNTWSFYTAKELKPTGWLLRQLEIQAQGLSGHLDKMWPDVKDSAWIGGDREGWERVPYWLDGFIPLAYLLEDEDMIARAKRYVDAILARQQPDGWICPCGDAERKGYDTWAVQLICKVLVVYYECSGDERIPSAVYRILKNYYELLKNGEISLFDWGKFRWFEAFVAIRFVYETCKEDWLKELAGILKRQGADYSTYTEKWKRPLNDWKFETHIVNLAMMLKSEAVSCDLLGEAYTDFAEAMHTVLTEYNGTVYGSYTGDECLSGLSAIQGTELCAIVEQMYSCELLYAYTGDAKWVQRLEILAFNALPAALSEDMWTHQYVQMSNQIACCRFNGKPIFRTNGKEAHLFGLEPNFGCCTANFNQGWPKFALSAMMHREGAVISALMLPCRLQADGVDISVETEYPFRNRAVYCIRSEKDFTFTVRIPSFAERVKVNGSAFAEKEASFAIMAGDALEITVEFETAPRFVSRPGGLEAVRCGSLIFSVPVSYTAQKHEYERNGVVRKYPYCDYELIPRSPWNYAFCSREFSVERKGVSDVPFSSAQPPVVLKTELRQIDWGYEDGYETVCAKLPLSLKPISDPTEAELYPYGCTKLRMTELPVI